MTSESDKNYKRYYKHIYYKLHHKLLKSSSIKLSHDDSDQIPFYMRFVFMLITIIWYCVIIYYIHHVEKLSCKCKIDWRHTYLKIMSYINIIASLISFMNINLNLNPSYVLIIEIIIIILNAIYIYALYTYINVLNSSNCACATTDLPQINKSLDQKKNYILFLYIMGIITVITNIDIGITLHFNKKSFKYLF